MAFDLAWERKPVEMAMAAALADIALFTGVPGFGSLVKNPSVVNKAPAPGMEPETSYQTYTGPLKDGSIYSGKTSGLKTPEENVKNRFNGHHRKSEFAEPPKLDKSSTNPDAIRGREQQLIDKNGHARSQEGTSGNHINGISPNNPRRDDYFGAAIDEFGPMP